MKSLDQGGPSRAVPNLSWRLIEGACWSLGAAGVAVLFLVAAMPVVTQVLPDTHAAAQVVMALGSSTVSLVFLFAYGMRSEQPIRLMPLRSRQTLLVVIVIAMIYIYATGVSWRAAHNVPQFALLMGPSLRLSWIALFLAYCLLAPLAEELFYRGWLWEGLTAASVRPFWVASAVSAFWLLMHADQGFSKMIVLAPIAAGLALLRILTGGVGVPIVAHMLSNMSSMLTIPLVNLPR